MVDGTQVQAQSLQAAEQLAQVRVPLEDAGAAFESRDASGRTPIVLVPMRNSRVRLEMLGAAAGLVVLGILALVLGWSLLLIVAAFVVAVVCVVLGLMSAFFVRVPEGTSAMLVQGGRHRAVLGPGAHVVPPWIAVSHMVTRRQVPFALPHVDATTQDNVTASVDALATFSIADPARFVYSIAVPDFDIVLQAACFQAVRALIRGQTWSSMLDLSIDQASQLRSAIGEAVSAFGVQIDHLSITRARPEPAFLQAEGARQLAVVQRAEQAERQTLAERRQHDQDTLLNLRLAHLEEALREYPAAANWEWQGAQLDVARALASNGRAVVQLGRPADVVSALLLQQATTDEQSPRSANGETVSSPEPPPS